ncbi:MAG: alpha/beta fold hydrolase [Pseudomonadota bacterium]
MTAPAFSTPSGHRSVFPFAVALLALALIGVGVWNLERQNDGLVVSGVNVGTTPVTMYAPDNSEAVSAPLVLVAHGFAGSRPLMASYSLALAQAGYVVATYDFEGHGRNPVPMSGDVDAIEGTTQLLVDETLRVLDAGLQHPLANGQVAILGHSMASDIIVRAAEEDERIGPVVAISPFSQAVTPTHPQRLLMITGAWEQRLRDFALEALQMIDPAAQEDETVTANGVIRRGIVIPNAEHVAVLYNRTAIAEAVDWIDASFDRPQNGPIPSRIGWIFLVLSGTVILAWPLAKLLPSRAPEHIALSNKRFAGALLVPMLAVPLVAVWVPTGFLPVLVADYLAVHLFAYGLIQLLFLKFLGLRVSAFSIAVGLGLAVFGIAVFGLALDRYIASFVPHLGRLPIILALVVGAVPFMLADSAMAHAHPQLWRRALIRLAFLGSLAIAVALDFEGLFFLILIIPIIALFFIVFGLMGRWVEARGGPLASGLGLGLLLAWSLGVTFPMFV